MLHFPILKTCSTPQTIFLWWPTFSSMEWSNDLLLIVGGLLAGIVNTISGSGTLFSLGVMTFTGVPLVMANTTTRPSVLFQNLTAILVLRKHNQFNFKELKPVPIITTCAGAMLGAWCATLVSDESFNLLATAVMLLLLSLYISPSKVAQRIRLKSNTNSTTLIGFLLFLGGFYGGFIQIGVGILILAILSNIMKIAYAQANTYKLIIILIYTIPTTLFFGFTDNILWRPALLLAIGQVIGAFAAARFISRNHKAHIWAKRITVIMIIATLIKVWLFQG